MQPLERGRGQGWRRVRPPGAALGLVPALALGLGSRVLLCPQRSECRALPGHDVPALQMAPALIFWVGLLPPDLVRLRLARPKAAIVREAAAGCRAGTREPRP